MNLPNQQRLVAIHKELATATKWQPSPRCRRCQLLATQLASVTALYCEILDSVLRKEIRQSYAKRILSILMEAIKGFARVS
ncbi:MAG: hypothetical protein WC659_06900 [Patescibacteria group bacterium]